ncbi:MAG: hypothetical protein JNM94_12885 [Phycisphaerae bacterium]|nr:hypothetical protein [Phycisphaerae bacterium]
MDAPLISPRDFLRRRRPELFSDSLIKPVPVLDRSRLEYHLATLSSRKQHEDFETFARLLAQREICPNLVPQTGPTGGGDGGFDSETLPVSPEIARSWYRGINSDTPEAAWGFAFSTKKDWKAKCRSDIEGIVSSGRGYSRAYFITSQSIPQKDRVFVEARLREKHGIEVRILDLNWILDRVFEGRHQSLAIEALAIDVPKEASVSLGPLDSERAGELDRIEELILRDIQEKTITPVTVDRCIDSALLARGLDRPRIEVEGRFDRAERLAKSIGAKSQLLDCAYHRGWTSYWWWEDFPELSRRYDDAVQRSNSASIFDLEQVHNLLMLLQACVNAKTLTNADARIDDRTAALTSSLRAIAENNRLRSMSLRARSLLVQGRLTRREGDPTPLVGELRRLLKECDGLIGFPAEMLVKLILEVAPALEGASGLDELVSDAAEVSRKRTGEASAATIHVRRGLQLLDAGKTKQAIIWVGRALHGLWKHETRVQLTAALYILGSAYASMGLPWAARGAYVASAALEADHFMEERKLSPRAAEVYRSIKWCELELGRVGHALAWHHLELQCRHYFSTAVDQKDPTQKTDAQISADDLSFDSVLGLRFLLTPVATLGRLTHLPEALARLGLLIGATSLQFALGHEDAARADTQWEANPAAMQEFLLKLRDQPASESLFRSTTTGDEPVVEMESRLLGCNVTLTVDSGGPCACVGESVLGTLEAFAGTLLEEAFATRPSIRVAVRLARRQEEMVLIDEEAKDGRLLTIWCSDFDCHDLSADEQLGVREKTLDIALRLFARMQPVPDVLSTLHRLFAEDHAHGRARDFATSVVALSKSLGNRPRTRVSDWSEESDATYPLMRTERWDNGLPPRSIAAVVSKSEPVGPRSKPPNSPATDGLEVPKLSRHDQISAFSVIDDDLWDRAGWHGMAFFVPPHEDEPPILALQFHDPVAAAEIVDGWERHLGSDDVNDRIRVTLLRGVLRSQPHAYRVAIGSGHDVLASPRPRLVLLKSRFHTMEPTTSENLDRFLSTYHQRGRFKLQVAAAVDGRLLLYQGNAIVKSQLVCRDAWTICRHELESSALLPSDDPIVPDDVSDPPCVDTLSAIRSRRTDRPLP